MNVRPLVPILLSAMLLTGCGNKYITKVGNKEIYKTNVEKISHNDTGDWVLSGTSDAPDNSKILVTNYDKESMDYGSNSSESAKSPASFAIVQDGKFKVSVDPVGLTDSNDQKAGKKTKLLIFAVANYNKKWESVTIPKNIVNKARESQKPETVSISKSQEKYIKDLDKDISSSKSKNKNNSKVANTTTNDKDTNASNDDKVPSENKAALEKAKTYSSLMHLSKQGIYDQLTSEAGEKFPATAAQYAVDHLKADYNANALAKAKDYRKQQNMSDDELREQLTSDSGEQFTPQEADYAIQHLND